MLISSGNLLIGVNPYISISGKFLIRVEELEVPCTSYPTRSRVTQAPTSLENDFSLSTGGAGGGLEREMVDVPWLSQN